MIGRDPDGETARATATSESAPATRHWDLRVQHPSGVTGAGPYAATPPTDSRARRAARRSEKRVEVGQVARRSAAHRALRSQPTVSTVLHQPEPIRQHGDEAKTMSRIERLRRVQPSRPAPETGREPGDQENIDRWSERASENFADRASRLIRRGQGASTPASGRSCATPRCRRELPARSTRHGGEG